MGSQNCLGTRDEKEKERDMSVIEMIRDAKRVKKAKRGG